MRLNETETTFMEYVKKMEAFKEALQLIYWDLRTGAPKKGVKQRSQVIGTLSDEYYQMSISEEMAAFIAKLSGQKEELPELVQKTLEECKTIYDRNKKIPPNEYKEYVILQTEAENVWEEAREKSDFAMFKPYLEKLVDFNKKFIEYWGYKGNKYDTLLDLYEPGVTVETVDKEFETLKGAIAPLIQKINESGNKQATDFLYQPFPKEKQREFSLKILEQMGYDLGAGRLDETIHPFATGLNPGDVRITTRYYDNDWRMAVFGTIHEGGHALYEQNISEELIGTPLCRGTSMGIHESQSLFYENILARDKSFWEYNLELLRKYAGGILDHIRLDEFYRAINKAEPSLIRIESDNLTYSLHIIIRYEIEKGLFNNEINVEDLPDIWNDKYEQYLGIRPKNDAEGVLQDVHWAAGNFGYFPSYALGYMYAAQIKNAMVREITEYDGLLKSGNLKPIKEWLTKHIHRYGKTKKPLELIKEATGEGLSAKYLTDYLVKKYSAIYNL
ncbi:carboxypeptidase M32 [Siminovitchia fortis]|uniref:Metal-dependent carboxypeptidase n=1 Tax=Siminovitchia fortis TaxID=254758 RepID=A0A443IS36_9BACI|nr:carboxypeptidase M32 [Siminovitchia fortis]RWR10401.1 carboxypeptidase M32 [Siminovitchia fortis]WHY82924.1 carboxypeptidase M32 [Siminovitchia fortis]